MICVKFHQKNLEKPKFWTFEVLKVFLKQSFKT